MLRLCSFTLFVPQEYALYSQYNAVDFSLSETLVCPKNKLLTCFNSHEMPLHERTNVLDLNQLLTLTFFQVLTAGEAI
jgi:hypothetical protein